jgi:AcrR family transcriptional regulator
MDVKARIIEATIDLIKKKNGDVKLVTTREIVKNAGVSVALINYHFQSKKNLIDICVKQIISNVINQSNPNMEELSPIEKLKHSVKIPVDFLMENPEISKISILGDLMQGQSNDNTFKTLERYYFYANNLNIDEDVFFETAFLIHGLQGIFLRKELYKDKFDFADKLQRDILIDRLIEKLFGAKNE